MSSLNNTGYVRNDIIIYEIWRDSPNKVLYPNMPQNDFENPKKSEQNRRGSRLTTCMVLAITQISITADANHGKVYGMQSPVKKKPLDMTRHTSHYSYCIQS